MTRFWTCFLIFSSLLIIVGCNGDTPSDVKETESLDDSMLADTIFGNLTPYQQYTQHFLVEIPSVFQKNIDSLRNWIIENQPGALMFRDWDRDSLFLLKASIDTFEIIQPLYYEDYFDYLELPVYPYWESSEKNRALKWCQLFEKDRIGLVDFSREKGSSEIFNQWIKDWGDSLGTSFVTNYYQDKNIKTEYQRFIQSLRTSDDFLSLELAYFDTTSLENFRDRYGFRGLFLVDVQDDKRNQQLANGADLIKVSTDGVSLDIFPFEKWKTSGGNTAAFEASTKRILGLKQRDVLHDVFNNAEERKETVRQRIVYESTALISDKSGIVPFERGISIYSENKIRIDSRIRKESKVKVSQNTIDSTWIQSIKERKGRKIIFIPDTASDIVLQELAAFNKKEDVLLCFSNVNQYTKLSESSNLLFYPDKTPSDINLLLQQLSGQLRMGGDFMFKNERIKGKETNKTRLAYTSPSFLGLSRDTLRQIDYAVQSAINGKAFPGCQVLIAKEGCVFYDKSFGHHSYRREKSVTNQSLYDVASLTKVVATTLVAMKLYEMGAYDLEDSLSRFLPDSLSDHLKFPSTIRNITFQELLIHKSGLPAGFPVLPYMQYTSENIGRFDAYYCDRPDSVYSIEVAENFFLEKVYEDSMWLRLNRIWLDPNKPYKYSDVNMNTLYFVFMSIIENDPKKYCGYNVSQKERKERNLFVEFLYSKFYKPLGMERTKYKPLKDHNKGEIVPTENERYWRKQLLQGHVHDPNAALYGGIGGNAGIFSTTRDLAIYMEMLLRKGVYNGERYLKAETVNKFVQAQPNSHRGLGFNKPSMNTGAFGCAESAPLETFGHTGFTGTCFWVDPVNELTFVFLSNRVHPSVNNRIYQYGIRKRAHEYAYSAELF